MADIFEYIEQCVIDKLTLFNEGKSSGKGSYYMLMPGPDTACYTLWFFNPKAVYHPYVRLNNLDIDAINSVNKAIRIVANTFYTLEIISSLESSPTNGDDIITFGKYRGYHLQDIYLIDPKYVAWIAGKYEAHVKSEQRFKEMAITYSQAYMDLHTPRIYKIPVSQYVGVPGEKLTGLHLTIIRVRLEDDSYKTCIIRGTPSFYVDQLITASDEAGNLFFLSVKATDRSLESGTLSHSAYPYKVGEKLEIISAKVLKHVVSRNIKYTKLGYVRFAK